MKFNYILATMPLFMLIAAASGQMDVSGEWTYNVDTGFVGILHGTQNGNAVRFAAPMEGLPYLEIVGTLSGYTFTGTFREGDPNVPDYGRTFGSVTIAFSAPGTFVGEQCWENGHQQCHNWEGWRK